METDSPSNNGGYADKLNWEQSAACKNMGGYPFFPKNDVFEQKHVKLDREKQAKAICSLCDVRVLCLEYALQNNEQHGIWGGANESERVDIRKRIGISRSRQ